MVEGTFGAPYSVVALAAYEALSQFDSENNNANLFTVNYVNIVDEVTRTFVSTFEDELKTQQNIKLDYSSRDHPGQHLGMKSDKPVSNEGQIAAAVAEMPHASMAEEPLHIITTVCYYTCTCELIK